MNNEHLSNLSQPWGIVGGQGMEVRMVNTNLVIMGNTEIFCKVFKSLASVGNIELS